VRAELSTTTQDCVVAELGPAISQRIGGEPRFQFWFGGKTKFNWADGRLMVGVPNRFYQEYIEKKFGEAVRAAAIEVYGQPVQVRFAIDPELFQADRRAQDAGRDKEAPAAAPILLPVSPDVDSAPAQRRRPVKRTRRWRQLSEFIVGACNRLAHAAAQSAVESPGQCANPLVLHGPVGTGKTHLLEGVYIGLRKAEPEWRVLFVTAEEYTNRFLQAMHHGKLSAFRRYFRECDALLVDDLNFLAGKRATEEEFLHTFDALQGEGKQVVLTADCHPRLADEFSAELTDRLLGGAVWSLAPPEAETRLALLRAQATAGTPPIPDDVLRHLSAQLRGNVRELQGAVHSVRHYSRVAGRPVDLDLAREALGDLLRHALRVVQLADVDRTVCKALRLESGALQSKQRAWAVSHPRMLAMYLARKHTTAAYSEIGHYFGGRNHSTAVAAEKKVRQWLRDGGELVLGPQRFRARDVVELIERELHR
jgi:chromosomal replication initiator protein